jgi:hypothetical protein
MRTAKVTYNAPARDNKVVEMGGVTFYDGQAVELNTDDNGIMLVKLQTNQHFDVEMGGEEEAPKKRGRPSNASKLLSAAPSEPEKVAETDEPSRLAEPVKIDEK